MKPIHKNFTEIFFRYAILILSSFGNLWIFYLVFTPLTVYPTYFILRFFFDAILIQNVIIINNEIPIELIKACIAGSAYFLLFILNLSTPKINFEKRIKMLFLAFLTLLVFNVLRIIILSFIFLEGLPLFVAAHQFFWYFLSTIFVVIIWFSEVKIFRIKEIPFYSDMKFLRKHSFLKR